MGVSLVIADSRYLTCNADFAAPFTLPSATHYTVVLNGATHLPMHACLYGGRADRTTRRLPALCYPPA